MHFKVWHPIYGFIVSDWSNYWEAKDDPTFQPGEKNTAYVSGIWEGLIWANIPANECFIRRID